MPVELSDNTKINQFPKLPYHLKILPLNQALLWDGDKIKRYLNMLNFYNNNFWGFGTFGRLTNYDPSSSQGLAAIQSNFDYAKRNTEIAEGLLSVVGVGKGILQAVKWAATPVKIGQGAEAVVKSAPLSPQVTKITTIPRTEMHARNMVPRALKAKYIKTKDGLTTYTQPKVHILSKKLIPKASKVLEKIMSNTRWRKITHPNMLGIGFTDGNWVISDLGPGNIGRDWLGRLRLVDFSMERLPAFRAAMLKQGGKLINND